uniref:F-box/LRR-repeat protein 15-like leucin rich repeat domain-containing protein n=1 Tax=Opuntia streptacantha TaxID=393608 RepID=A0A7C9DW94_OPUST
MDSVLCDELMIEIFHRLPAPSSTVSLVSKRWLRLFRQSKTSLSLLLPPPPHHGGDNHLSLWVSSLISQYPFVSSLSLSSTSAPSTTTFDDVLIAAASSCLNLKHLRFLASPVSLSSLLSLSSCSSYLTSLTIPLSRPLNFSWIPQFPALKELSVVISGEPAGIQNWVDENFGEEVKLEFLTVSGLSWGDLGMGWVWRNCLKLKKLHLRSCEGVGDGGSYSSFSRSLKGLTEVELRSCRTISDMVLLKLAENSTQLHTLLVYDGGSKDGLLQFINNSQSDLKKIDLRLPLDLNNDHLSAMAESFRTLTSLRLQSCCLVTGDGLKTFSQSLSNNLEELALINCDVVERVPGLLTTLGQNLKGLKRLDLSHNETLIDKELVSMLVSCEGIVELRLRGCKGLTNMATATVIRVCRNLESVDVVQCGGIDDRGVEILVSNLKKLKTIKVEESKLSDVARNWLSKRTILVSG